MSSVQNINEVSPEEPVRLYYKDGLALVDEKLVSAELHKYALKVKLAQNTGKMYVEGPTPLLVVDQLTVGNYSKSEMINNLKIVLSPVTNCFGSGIWINICTWVANKQIWITQSAVELNAIEFVGIDRGDFYVTIRNANTPLFWIHCKFLDIHKEQLRKNIEFIGRNFTPIIPDKLGFYWSFVQVLRKYPQLQIEKRMNSGDLLSLGWVNCYTRAAQLGIQVCEQLYNDTPPTNLRLPSNLILQGFINAVLDGYSNPILDKAPLFNYEYCFKYLVKLNENGGLLDLILYSSKLAELSPNENWLAPSVIFEITWEFFALCGATTDGGKMQLWIDELGNTKKLRLSPHLFSETFCAEDFWHRAIINSNAVVRLGRYVTGHDVPVNTGADGFWDLFPCTDNCEDADDAASSLLSEAFAGKRFTIPTGAVVQFKFGPFSAVELYEDEIEVTAVFRTTQSEYSVVAVNPKNNAFMFSALIGCRLPDERANEIWSVTKVLLASIIRDFYVLEERAQAFRYLPSPQRSSRKSDAGYAPRIVYLPRVKYNSLPDTRKLYDEFNYPRPKRSHSVSGHVRKSRHASEAQLVLAARYGFKIEEGHTFVRPHVRGGKNASTVYKSRSASAMLYESRSFIETTEVKDAWLEFEKDVYTLLEKMGFRVQHIGKTRSKDGGVDLTAVKGSGLEEVAWIIQCKCWSPHRKLDPKVIREFMGVLQQYPRGVRGMIVTTSSLTSGAKRLADEYAIAIVDGIEFGNWASGTSKP